VLQDVTVLQAPSECDQQQAGSVAGTVSVAEDAQLLAALSDPDVNTVLVTADMILQRERWQVGGCVGFCSGGSGAGGGWHCRGSAVR